MKSTPYGFAQLGLNVEAGADASMKAIMRALAALALATCGAFAARADCASFVEKYKVFQAEKVQAVAELQRVQAIKPSPIKDARVCSAMRTVITDAPYFIIYADAECFANNQNNVETFKKDVDGFASNAATLAGGYCTAAELKTRATSKLDMN